MTLVLTFRRRGTQTGLRFRGRIEHPWDCAGNTFIPADSIAGVPGGCPELPGQPNGHWWTTVPPEQWPPIPGVDWYAVRGVPCGGPTVLEALRIAVS